MTGADRALTEVFGRRAGAGIRDDTVAKQQTTRENLTGEEECATPLHVSTAKNMEPLAKIIRTTSAHRRNAPRGATWARFACDLWALDAALEGSHAESCVHVSPSAGGIRGWLEIRAENGRPPDVAWAPSSATATAQP